MFALDQSLAGTYHAQQLRAEAARDALARQASTHPLRTLVRRLGR